MRRRVLWLVKGLGRGGAERLLTLMAPKISASGFDLDVAYLLPGEDAFFTDLQQAGISTICLDARRTIDLRWVSNLRRLLRTTAYDLVHTHSPVPAVAARLLCRTGVPIVHTEHNLWERYHRLTFAANAATYHRNALALAVSDGVAASIRPPRWARSRLYPPVRTLLHGVNPEDSRVGPDARREARERLGLHPSVPVIGNVANLTPKKDHAGLLDAIDRLRRRFPDVIALVVGTGPLEQELRADAARRGLDRNVLFLGMRDDVLEILPALDVFVLSSRFEGLPISMLEAMVSEIACVVTSVGGIPEALQDGEEGVLVPPGDPEALAHALERVLADPDQRHEMGLAAGRRVRADFSIDRAVRSHIELYEALTSAGEPQPGRSKHGDPDP